MLKFRKMHGLGNDFVILDGRSRLPKIDPAAIADRHRGVGCDQVIVMEPSKAADIFMRIYNPDGSEAGACGNASRCVADILMKETGKESCAIETRAGVLKCRRAGQGVEVDMGPARLEWHEIPLAHECDTLHLPLDNDPAAVSMGNPHCVFVVENAEKVDAGTMGPLVEKDALFPEKTNVEFISIAGKDHIRMRVWERGAGITQACGSGACAAAVTAVRRELTGRKVRVTLDGGDLSIEWRESDGHVLMTGPAAHVFEGVFAA